MTPPIEARIGRLMEAEHLTREDAITKFMEHRSPSGRFVSQQNITALIAFLCGPFSADFNGAACPSTQPGCRGADPPEGRAS